MDATVEACKSVPEVPQKAVGFVHAVLRQLARQVAAGHQGSRSELARKLGISERSLYRKLKNLKPSDE